MSEQLLQQAIEAIRTGDKEAGKRFLVALLNNEPQNEQGWLWMSAVVNNNRQRRQCLETVLQINPNNERARLGLSRLEAKQVAEEQAPSLSPPPPPEATRSEATPLNKSDPWPDKQSVSKRQNNRLLVLLGGLLLVCLCCASPMAVLSNLRSSSSTTPSDSIAASERRVIPPTYTPASPRQSANLDGFSRDRSEFGEIAISRPQLAEYAERSSLGMSFYRDLTYSDGTYHHTLCTRNCEQKLVMRSETNDRNELDNLDYSFIYTNSDQFTMRSLSMLAVVGLAIPTWGIDLDQWYIESAENYLKTGRETYYSSRNGIDVQLDFFYDTIDREEAVIISVME